MAGAAASQREFAELLMEIEIAAKFPLPRDPPTPLDAVRAKKKKKKTPLPQKPFKKKKNPTPQKKHHTTTTKQQNLCPAANGSHST